MRKTFYQLTVISVVLAILFIGLYIVFEYSIFKSLAITFSTTLYHFSMRLAVGYSVEVATKDKKQFRSSWFNVTKTEKALYRFLNIKKLKRFVPTFNPEHFDVRKISLEQVVETTCRSEIVHEIIVVLSFVPLVAAVFFDSFRVFFITSVVAALIDLIFVIVQRYNRPRLLKLIEIRKNNS